MAYPQNVGVVDLMIGFPFRDKKAIYEYLMPGIKDAETKDGFAMPAEYMFKQTPDEAGDDVDPIVSTFAQMDRYGIDIGLFGLSEQSIEAQRRFPGRVAFVTDVDPNDVMGAIRKVQQAKADHDLKAVSVFPCRMLPAGDRSTTPRCTPCMQPASSCDIPVIVNAGDRRSPLSDRPASDVELLRRGLLGLPRAEDRHAPRRRALGGPGRQADAQVAGPVLHAVAPSPPSTTPRPSSTTPTPGEPTRSCTPGTSPPGCPWSGSSPSCPTCGFKDEVWPKFLRENARSGLQAHELSPASPSTP